MAKLLENTAYIIQIHYPIKEKGVRFGSEVMLRIYPTIDHLPELERMMDEGKLIKVTIEDLDD